MKKLSPLLIMMLFFVTCKKQETNPPAVSLFSPMSTDSFYITDSVPVSFTVSDKNLQSFKIIVSNFYSHKILYNEETVADANEITVNKRIFVSADADTTAYINVLGIDKNGNTGNAGTKFKIKI